jgi:aminoglycoside phosphotransferase (APT) family kinase protein
MATHGSASALSIDPKTETVEAVHRREKPRLRQAGTDTGPAYRIDRWRGTRRYAALPAVTEASETTPPGIDAARVARFFAEHVPGGDAPLDVSLLSGGRSNLTYRVRTRTLPPRDFVLRRPPLGHVLPTAHDMAREYRVLAALAPTDVPVPRPIALCEDAAVNGAPFYVMEYRPGIVLEGPLPAGFAPEPDDRRRIGAAVVETLARLHAVAPDTVGLADLGRPEGYLERQVKRWMAQWERSKTRELASVDEVARRLVAALPERSRGSIVHGDYRLGNLCLEPDDPGRVVAIFDWEMATLGDPLADLGWLLVYWGEPGDPPERLAVSGHAAAITAAAGFPSRAEIVAAYARRAGIAPDAVDFYEVLAFFKLAIISEGIHARFLQGKTVGEGFRGENPCADLLCLALARADESGDVRLHG